VNVNELTIELKGKASNQGDNQALKRTNSSQNGRKSCKDSKGAFKGSGHSIAVVGPLNYFQV